MFMRYYADSNMKSDAEFINHKPKIFSCTIACKI